jgi:hypothetical protein
MNKIDSPIEHSDEIHPEFDIIPNHPLASIAGQFKGIFWEAILKEIQRQRNADRQKNEVNR